MTSTWNFAESLYTDRDNGVAPGTYKYTFDVKTGDNSAITKQFTIDVTLLDPCLDLTMTQPTNGKYTYTITDEGTPIDLDPKFIITPAFCELDLSIVQEPVDNIPNVTFDEATQ